MRSLRLTNVRSFSDTKDVPLRALTVLVGQNASGKSTFARWLPLLRQSVVRPTAAPLLWYVDGGDVDFGSISQVAHPGAAEVGFSFELDHAQGPQKYGRPKPFPENTRVTIALDARDPQSHVTRVELERDEDRILIGFRGALAVSAVLDRSEIEIGIATESGTQHILPVTAGSTGGGGYAQFAAQEEWSHTPLHHRLFNALCAIRHGKTGNATVHRIAHDLAWTRPHQFRKVLAESRYGPPTWHERVGEASDSSVEAIRRLVAVRESVAALRGIDLGLRAEATAVGYVGPFRKSPSRYERVSDIATELVDHTGANLPMVLRSMSKEEREELSNWLMERFGFGVGLAGEEHVQVRILEPSGRETNIIDTGFGFSQILPVAVAIWRLRKDPQRRTRTLVLEQPELHLHPAMQARLGQLLASVAKDAFGVGDPEFRLIVETHSEALINAIGEAVEIDGLNRKAVSVVLFERDPVSGTSTARVSEFDAKGRLQDWPFGFLTA